MKAYKGFDKDLKCRGFQYEIGKEYEDPEAIVCNRGFHACEEPIDVLKYYEPGKGSRYCEVEQDGQLSRSDEDSKIASTKLKVVGEIGIPGIAKEQIEYVKSRCTNEHNAEPGKPATAGESGAATAGDYGAATAGYRGAATAGESGSATAGESGSATAGDYGAATSRGSVSVGKNGVGAVRGEGAKIKGDLGALLVCAIEGKFDYDVVTWAAAIVDGEKIKPDTWYTVENGEFVEV